MDKCTDEVAGSTPVNRAEQHLYVPDFLFMTEGISELLMSTCQVDMSVLYFVFMPNEPDDKDIKNSEYYEPYRMSMSITDHLINHKGTENKYGNRIGPELLFKKGEDKYSFYYPMA